MRRVPPERVSADTQARLAELREKEETGTLTAQEAGELEFLTRLRRLVLESSPQARTKAAYEAKRAEALAAHEARALGVRDGVPASRTFKVQVRRSRP